MNIIATIPARLGSKKIQQKNLRLINGFPLFSYAVNAAKGSKKLNDVFVNSESDEIGKIAKELGVKYYKRDKALAEDHISPEEFTNDFMMNIDADIVVMVNPVAPLILADDIDIMIDYYMEHELDTLIPVKEEHLHTFYNGKAVNFNSEKTVQSFCTSKPLSFNMNSKNSITSSIEPIKICSWTVCIWRAEIFKKKFKEKGYAMFSGKIGFFAQDSLTSFTIRNENDFFISEVLLKNRNLWTLPSVSNKITKLALP
jgi:CMP-N,N'-diacetyllegionaminic acid synthase